MERVTVRLPVMPLVATAAMIALRLCGDPEVRPAAPAIAVAADRYTVAWMRPSRHGGVLLVAQFARDTLKPLGSPHAVVERADLREGGVELIAVDGGYVAVSRVEDPEKKPNWATQILTVRLDANGNASGEQRSFMLMDHACGGAGVIGDRVVMAYKAVGRSHRHPDDVLGLLAVDRDGGYIGDRVVAHNPIACASAVRGRELAVAWTRWAKADDGSYTAVLRVGFEEPFRDGRDETFAVPVGSVDAGPVRIAPHGDGWAILYGDRDEHLHVAFVDDAGTLQSTRDLPPAIDGDTADLATNERGLFVTWIDGSRARVLGLDGAPRALGMTGARASDTRALGDGARCVAAWTTSDGKGVRIARAADCP